MKVHIGDIITDYDALD